MTVSRRYVFLIFTEMSKKIAHVFGVGLLEQQ